MRPLRSGHFSLCRPRTVTQADISAGEGRVLKNNSSLKSLEPIKSIGTKKDKTDSTVSS